VQMLTEKVEYCISLPDNVDDDQLEDIAQSAVSKSASELLKKYTPHVQFDGNDVDWSGNVWYSWRITYHVSPLTKLALDLLDEFDQ
jgi:hypothetical protein